MTDRSKDPLVYIHVFLLKKSITDPKAAIARNKRPKVLSADDNVLPGGRLYFQAPPPNQVPWREFLVPAFGDDLPPFDARHASAVLFFPAGKRIFAVTFGYGKSLLSPSALESDFGLRTALNLCEPTTLRAVDYRTIEERTRIGRVQLSDEASVAAFRMDMDTDLLKGLEARSKDLTTCERLAAKWASLTVAARVQLDDLPQLATKLIRAYSRKKLPAEFEWIDNIRRVGDPTLAELLDAELSTRLDSSQLGGIRLAMPEISGDIIGMNAAFFEPYGPPFTSDVAVYLASRKRKVKNTIEAAKKSHDVVLIDAATGAEKDREAVYRCMVAEIQHQGELYLLADGEWFVLDHDFVADVNRALGRIPTLKHGMPAWNQGEEEAHYNERACKAWKDAALLDKQNIRHGGGAGQVEPADWVSKDRTLGYVKRRDKNSQGLSHLFAQGSVGAELISRDRSYRRKLAVELPASHSSVTKELKAISFDPRHWTVAFVVLGADAANPAGGLPFFSKVNLRKHAERLAAMQFRVGLIGI